MKFSVGTWELDCIHNVDCATGLRQVPSDSLDVVVTSPPYWGQRGAGGLGSEPDPREYVANLVAILADALRCLKPWLNTACGQFRSWSTQRILLE